MKHATAPIATTPVKDGGVRDSVETAIDLAKGMDRESWEQRLREEPGRIPKWGGGAPHAHDLPAGNSPAKAAKAASCVHR